MDRSVTPSFVEEATSVIEIVKVSRVFVPPEEVHVANLEVGPEMAGRVSVGIAGVFGSELVISQPCHHIIIGEVGRIRGEELLRCWPKFRDTLGCVEKVDRETVGLVAVLHEPEDIVVNVAEELDLGLNAPVVAVLL